VAALRFLRFTKRLRAPQLISSGVRPPRVASHFQHLT